MADYQIFEGLRCSGYTKSHVTWGCCKRDTRRRQLQMWWKSGKILRMQRVDNRVVAVMCRLGYGLLGVSAERVRAFHLCGPGMLTVVWLHYDKFERHKCLQKVEHDSH